MTPNVIFLLNLIMAFITPGCHNTPEDVTRRENSYRNPVSSLSLPDPTIIRGEDGMFYLYATEDTRNTPIHRSSDLVTWEFLGTAFTGQTRPSFEPKGGIWAPDINFINGRYVLYYSMSVWGGEWTCGIGIATAEKPEGPFTDQGKLFPRAAVGPAEQGSGLLPRAEAGARGKRPQPGQAELLEKVAPVHPVALL